MRLQTQCDYHANPGPLLLDLIQNGRWADSIMGGGNLQMRTFTFSQTCTSPALSLSLSFDQASVPILTFHLPMDEVKFVASASSCSEPIHLLPCRIEANGVLFVSSTSPPLFMGPSLPRRRQGERPLRPQHRGGARREPQDGLPRAAPQWHRAYPTRGSHPCPLCPHQLRPLPPFPRATPSSTSRSRARGRSW